MTNPAPIGIATMQADRTIIMDLRAEGDDKKLGDARFVYKPSDPKYKEILDHLPGLKPGSTVDVLPWETK